MSSWRIFCVTDFRDQVDNLSSNYLYPPWSVVIGRRGTLPEECQNGLCGLTGSSWKRSTGFFNADDARVGEDPKGIEEPWLEGLSVFHLLLL